MISYIENRYVKLPLLLCASFIIFSCESRQNEVDTGNLLDVVNNDTEAPEDIASDINDTSPKSPEDVDETVDIEHDTRPDIEEPPIVDLWPDFENRCARDYPLIQPPARDEQLLDPPDEIEISVKWRTSPSCPEPTYLMRFPYFGRVALHESSAGATVVAEHGFDWGLGYGVGALASIAADTGAITGCETILEREQGLTTSGPLLLHPGLNGAPLIAGNVQSWRDDPFPNPTMYWYSPAWEMPRHSLPGPAQPSATGVTVLLPDGQLLLFGYRGYLFSVDSYTGELNWILQPADFGVHTSLSSRTIAWRAEHNDFVVSTGYEPMTNPQPFVAIDRCGGVSQISKREFEWAHRREFGDGYWIRDLKIGERPAQPPGIYIETQEGQRIANYPDCLSVASLTADTIACSRPIQNSTQLEITFLKWGQAQVLEDVMILENTDDRVRTTYTGSGLTAFRDSVLVAAQGIEHLDEGGQPTQTYATRLFFINWKTREVIKIFDTPWRIGRHLLVTADGTIITGGGEWNEDRDIFALETNLHGFSPTSSP